jgi:hypothetical protein
MDKPNNVSSFLLHCLILEVECNIKVNREKNRKILSINPSDRKTQSLLENQFTKSMLILEPLKTRIKATDELIDAIVYRLYGLTEEEIVVVKGAVS